MDKQIVEEALPDWLNLTAWVEQTFAVGADISWTIYLFVILTITGLISFASGLILAGIDKAFHKTKSEWDNILVQSAKAPLKLLIYIIGISICVDLVLTKMGVDYFEDSGKLRAVAIVWMFIWALSRFVNRGSNYYIRNKRKKNEKIDLTVIQAISKLLKISLFITAVLITLQNLGVSISGLLAFGGLGGIAVGFAAKDMLANFFGALIVYIDQPFKVGDWVRSPDQEIEGTVEEISWRMTTIRTFDQRPLYVPNSVFTTISVENPSRMTHRRIYETIGIRYSDIGVMQAITDDIRTYLDNNNDIDSDELQMVYFNAFNESSCDFFIYCFTHTTVWKDFHAVKHKVLLNISDIIEKHEAEIAYPTQTQHFDTTAEFVTDYIVGEAAATQDAKEKEAKERIKTAKKSAPKEAPKKKKRSAANDKAGGESHDPSYGDMESQDSDGESGGE